MNYWLFTIPVLGSIIGWLINSIAISIVLKNIARKQPVIAEKISETAGKEFSFDEIEKKIGDPANVQKVLPLIEGHVDDFLKVRLTKEMPFLSMFIGDKTISTLKTTFLREIETLFPQVMLQFAGNLKTEFDPKEMIRKKLAAIPPEKIQMLIRTNLGRELRLFRLLGVIIGFITGAISLLILWLI